MGGAEDKPRINLNGELTLYKPWIMAVPLYVSSNADKTALTGGNITINTQKHCKPTTPHPTFVQSSISPKKILLFIHHINRWETPSLDSVAILGYI